MSEKIIYDYSKLRGRITEICGTQTEFAKRMGRERSLISLKLNNGSQFTQAEMSAACAILAIPDKEIGRYFFTQKVLKSKL